MKKTKKMMITIMTMFVLLVGFGKAFGQQGIQFDPTAPENLDLYAVAELFRDSENLEKFEQALNNPVNAISNLDLNNDNEIDFIRVTEQMKGDTRLVVLQAILGENEFQDVATLAIERQSGGRYNLQIQGDQTIYGANYYIVPVNENFGAWNVVRWLFSPTHRVYVSPYRYRVYPGWWSTRRPVTVSVYRAGIAPFAVRKNFVTTKTVRTINNINYRPRTSTLVPKKVNTTRTTTTTHIRNGNQPSGVTRTTTTTRTKTTTGRGKRN